MATKIRVKWSETVFYETEVEITAELLEAMKETDVYGDGPYEPTPEGVFQWLGDDLNRIAEFMGESGDYEGNDGRCMDSFEVV